MAEYLKKSNQSEEWLHIIYLTSLFKYRFDNNVNMF